ncbi:MAG: hypothetical protein KatS3mg031_1508 [Chitinophagales bacterium]|nr:MAG: hypothetical protein KatS3mg031_1508 [Chitinophagales bacterium]
MGRTPQTYSLNTQGLSCAIRLLSIATVVLLWPGMQAILFMSCNRQPENKVTSSEIAAPAATENPASAAVRRTFVLNTEQSMIVWQGKNKFTPKKHSGTLDFKEGFLTIDSLGNLQGRLIADMYSISSSEGLAKLEEHLKSADFFDVTNFPEAVFELLSAQPDTTSQAGNYVINGNLLIKGIARTLSFPATINLGDNQITASSDITIDRTEWDIRYRSDSFFPELVKDKVIDNNIQLQITLVAEVAPG